MSAIRLTTLFFLSFAQVLTMSLLGTPSNLVEKFQNSSSLYSNDSLIYHTNIEHPSIPNAWLALEGMEIRKDVPDIIYFLQNHDGKVICWTGFECLESPRGNYGYYFDGCVETMTFDPYWFIDPDLVLGSIE